MSEFSYSKPTRNPDTKSIRTAAWALAGAAILSVSFYCPGIADDIASHITAVFSPYQD